MQIAKRAAALTAALAMVAALPTAAVVQVATAAPAVQAAVTETGVEYVCTTETQFGSYVAPAERFNISLEAPAEVGEGARPRLRWSVDKMPRGLPFPVGGVSTRTTAGVAVQVAGGDETDASADAAKASATKGMGARDRWPGRSKVTIRPSLGSAEVGDVVTVSAGEFSLEVVSASDGISGSEVRCEPTETPVLAELTVVPLTSSPGRGDVGPDGVLNYPWPTDSAAPEETGDPEEPEADPAEGEDEDDAAPEWIDESVPVEDVEPPAPRRELIADVRFDTKQSLLAWLGGPASSDVVLRVANVGEVAIEDPDAVVRIGRGPEPSNVLEVPSLGTVAVGETVEVRAPVEFGAPAFGEYQVTVSIDGTDEPIFVSSSTSVYPWALIAIGWLLLQIPLLGLYRRKSVPVAASEDGEPVELEVTETEPGPPR